MRTIVASVFLVACAPFAATHLAAQVAIGTAPSGDAVTVATRVLRSAGHQCPKVLSAARQNDGSIRATCSNGEVYRLGTLQDDEVVMNCAAATKQGVKGC